MLELKQIVKDYPAGGGVVHALKGVSLRFRNSEFVSILGPSGCGKTTMLNIIGGLDQYTSGDLLINAVSTEKYKDRDWDAYRNHSIGFVFQSYNLIPHQSVLGNVEIALTLSGVSRRERRQRAKEALEKVGLGEQLHKRPSQMSGGQMQRVAIARAIVNDPDIILADEPTGALDTVTSVQVMDILKEIAKDRLVIMVTHNPDLANTYSTRIINMLDGQITGDSDPVPDEEWEEKEQELKAQKEAEAKLSRRERKEKKKKEKKPSMKLHTAFGLSLRNLFTKKGRTMLTSFAGSIGIIGIALIYALSNGFTSYIDMVQEQTLAAYPITIESTTINMSTLMETFAGVENTELDHELDKVYVQSALYGMLEAMGNIETTENDLASLKDYIESKQNVSIEEGGIHEALSGIRYTYDLDLLIYTKNTEGKVVVSDATEMFMNIMARMTGRSVTVTTDTAASNTASLMALGSGGSSGYNLWTEMLDGVDGEVISPLITEQYDLIYGSWPNEYNEVVLIVDGNNELDDLTLYALGLESEERMNEVIDAAAGEGGELKNNGECWTYEEICDHEYKVILNADAYGYDEEEGCYKDLRETESGLDYLYNNAIPLKITGIIRPDPDATSSMLSGSIAYTTKLTDYVMAKNAESELIQKQLADEENDVLSGLPFAETVNNMTEEDKAERFEEEAKGLSNEEKALIYTNLASAPDEAAVEQTVDMMLAQTDRQTMEQTVVMAAAEQTGMSEADLTGYIASMDDDTLKENYKEILTAQVGAQMQAQTQEAMAAMTEEERAAGFDAMIPGLSVEDKAAFFDQMQEISEASYEDNLRELGYVDPEVPKTVNLYASSFDNKDVLQDMIKEYNKDKDELERIIYTDYVGIMMHGIKKIINTISYVLIAFVAISLVVSSIMIGVITLISVQERTKEIGILRAIGASKANVSSMFNAETLIIGFTSGLFGVGLTYLLCIPINAIIHYLTDIQSLSAVLPWQVAVLLIAISMFLTLIAGIIPSRSAAKKDPVVALRTE